MGILNLAEKKSDNRISKLVGEKNFVNTDDLIKSTDTVNFVSDVIEVSRRVPVIVDFWAPWCNPCRTLGPVLEKLVRQFGGKVRMVKVNVDDNQKLASQLKVSSIPAVFAFKNGALVDRFVGALPESQIKTFFFRLSGGNVNAFDKVLSEARALLDKGDHKSAEALYRQCLRQDKVNSKALAGVANCLIARGDEAGANNLLRQLPNDLLAKPDITAVKTKLELSSEASSAISDYDLQKAIENDPDNHQVRYDLAMTYYRARSYQKAVDELLEIVRRDRTWNDDGARRQLVRIFEALGSADPLTVQSRRQLSSIMFS